MIKQNEIESILDLESQIKELTNQLNIQKKALNERIKEGEKVSKGKFHAYLKEVQGKRVPKYKELFTENVKDYESILAAHIESLNPSVKQVLTLERSL